ncbi:AzlD domain-containing protein [Paenibacillus thiaminolyticus]|uniref:AzlD domain-containing protein n=1 Tax=Paenibacillus thiaminolyticus TaxID=49283 RepID=A0A3A3GCA7_PANTH|nr:AzlD domain-containing protein [Paenibacillus thiaminolyticus]RJG18880.1 AzlD domain-containing protein [Paenibacillus thiaminolyticus]
MEVRWSFLMMLAGAALVTLIPRVLPLIVLSKKPLPEWGQNWLSHIPIAVMSALLAQELFVGSEGGFLLPLIAAAAAFAAAYFTRSLLITVVIGMAVIALLRYAASVL